MPGPFTQLAAGLRRLWMLVRGREFDRELEEEMQLHRELRAEELRLAGASPEDASAEAARRFGNMLRLREEAREQWGWRPLEELREDLRLGSRSLRRSFSFAVAVTTLLAAGIAASTAVFSIVRVALLDPLPYSDAEQLLVLSERTRAGESTAVSYPNFVDWSSRQRSFAAMGLFRRLKVVLGAPPTARLGAVASSGVLTALRFEVQIGRSLEEADDRRGAPPVVVLGDALWREYFKADPSVVGSLVTVNGVQRKVVGVLAPVVPFPAGAEIWISIGSGINDALLARNYHPGFYALARLSVGISEASAEQELELIAGDLGRRFPAETGGATVEVRSLADRRIGTDRGRLTVLAGIVGLVLLAICAHLAGLLLARGSTRRAEIAVRHALGAARARIARQLLTECLLLAAGGGLAGAALAPLGLRLILRVTPLADLRFQAAHLDWLGIAFALLLAAVTAALFGVWPAWKLAGAAALPPNRVGRGASERADRGSRLRWALTSAQVALALTLLLLNAPLLEELSRLRSTELGFDPVGLSVATIDGTAPSAPGRPALATFNERLLVLVRSLPGVEAVALAGEPPGSATWSADFGIAGGPALTVGESPSATIGPIDSGFFEAMGIVLRAGRSFTQDEVRARARVAIVDEGLARRFWPRESAIGKGLILDKGEPMIVVGVAPIVGLQGYSPNPKQFQIYLPLPPEIPLNPVLLVRSAMSPSELSASIVPLGRTIDAERLVFDVRALQMDLARPLRMPQLVASMSSALALFALILAGLGVHAAVAYSVHGRQFELGVRVAVGASPLRIAWFVARRSATAVATGTTLGALIGLTTRRVLFSAPGPGLWSAITPFGLPLLVYVLALSACLIPALRASRLQPAPVLRSE